MIDRPIHVLVIDDDPTIRQVIAFTLRDEGYHVDEASDGRAALQKIELRHPDIILLDMKMPGLDGWEFARVYRERFEHVAPIVVLTAATDAGQRATTVRADSYLQKPFDLDDLLDRVSTIVRRPSPS